MQCIRQGQVGGGESHLLSLVENLDRTRFEPVVLSFTDGPMVTQLRNEKIDVTVIHTERPFDIFKWGIIKDFVAQKNIDLVHAHGTRANSNINWASRSLNIPLIYTVHGWSFHKDQNFFVKNLRILGERYLTRRSRVNISVSESNKQSGKSYLKDFSSIVINNGINLDKFSKDRNLGNIRSELGLAVDDIVITFIARFTHQKQPLLLIQAFSKICAAYPKAHLLMVGEGELRTEAEELVRSLDLANRVTLQPFRSDIPDILAASDMYVLPSIWEGLPIGLLEAMAMGKAIVATKVDGTTEVISNEENGLLVASESETELAGALESLIVNEPLRTRLQHHALLSVKQKYTASAMTRQIEDIYLQLFLREK